MVGENDNIKCSHHLEDLNELIYLFLNSNILNRYYDELGEISYKYVGITT